ncbi:MAG: hypothetical protein ABWU16_05455 [Halothiobacillaceae bacterium]
MEGLHDIIPPAPVSGGLTGLMAQGGLPHPLLLLILPLLLALTLWFLRHRLQAALRLILVRRALRAGRLEAVERLIRRHLGLPHLHPERPPAAIDAQTWRTLIKNLHTARFGAKAMPLAELAPLLGMVFTPFPSREEGRRGGDEHPSPAAQASPARGKGEYPVRRP